MDEADGAAKQNAVGSCAGAVQTGACRQRRGAALGQMTQSAGGLPKPPLLLVARCSRGCRCPITSSYKEHCQNAYRVVRRQRYGVEHFADFVVGAGMYEDGEREGPRD